MTEIFNFLKNIVKLRLIIRKRSPNIANDVILQYISVPILKPPKLSKIPPHSKTIKNTKEMSVFGKNECCCLSNSLQTHIFESSIFFLEPPIKVITEIIDLQK